MHYTQHIADLCVILHNSPRSLDLGTSFSKASFHHVTWKLLSERFRTSLKTLVMHLGQNNLMVHFTNHPTRLAHSLCIIRGATCGDFVHMDVLGGRLAQRCSFNISRSFRVARHPRG
jgi:hypothetical protein